MEYDQNKCKLVIKKIVEFLRYEFQHRGFKKAIIGLSGGIDSAVVARLIQFALEHTIYESFQNNEDINIKQIIQIPSQEIHKSYEVPLLCLILPSSQSSQDNIADAQNFAHLFGIPYSIISIEHFEKALQKTYPMEFSLPRIGNACARFRMTILYDIAFAQQRIVIGTSNKSERLLGYGTIHGDMASGINPIGNIYKSNIFLLAQELKIPQNIILKPPSADLFKGQTDEKELGFSYAILDKILFDFTEKGYNKEQLIQQGHNIQAIELVLQKYHAYKFKQEPIPMAVV